MNTYGRNTAKYSGIVVVTAMLGLASLTVAAGEKTGKVDEAQLIYQSQTANHNIYSYSGRFRGDVAEKPLLVYVNRAYGPAIHSYEYTGDEIVVAWNVEYVDTAFGQAIYSYGKKQAEGSLELLPVARK